MWSYISTPHTGYGGAQLSTDSHTIHIIKFLYLQNYPRLSTMSGTCIGALMTSRRGTSLELLE